MNFFHHVLHAIAAVFATAAALGGGPGGPVATGSISAGIQAGPACITHTMHPGDTASTMISVVNPNRTGWEKLDMSQQTVLPIYIIQYAAPKSWVTLSAPGPGNWVGPGRSARVTATVTVPGNARPGRYTALPTVTAYAPGQLGGQRVAFGSAAATGLVFSVGVSAPPRAFCRGERPTYWPAPVLLPPCPGSVNPGRVHMCRQLPLPPPAVSAAACHMTPRAWRQYMAQLRLTHSQRFAHCYTGPPGPYGTSNKLNRMSYYRSTGDYRFS